MAIMSQTWTIFIVVTGLAVQLCIGETYPEKSCAIWSSHGPVVQRGTSFKVYCTFNCKCKGSMYSDHPPTLQKHNEVNSTTIYFNVANITKNRTYSCHCKCPSALDPCGLDISAGYLLERPTNISCVHKVKDNESGVVSCTWNRGRDTFLRNSSKLCVRTVSKSHADTRFNVSSRGTDFPSASFPVTSSVQMISVRVLAQNPLGSQVSVPVTYNLSDIAMPSSPALGQPECSSRECIVKVELPVKAQHLEIQYRTETQTWTSSPDTGVQMSSVQVRSISSLEPYMLYHFRARSKFSSGFWSPWSANISSWTQEEAPSKELDVWYAEPDSKSLRVYWKELNISTARGKIIEYNVSVYSPNSGLVFVNPEPISADARDYSVPFCADCEVAVWARNSKGPSPAARIKIHHTKAKSTQFEHHQDVQVTAGNHSVAISWRKHDTAPLRSAYVLEWYPEGHKLEELRWVRLGRNQNHAVVTGIKSNECYEGAVYVLNNESSVSRIRFSTSESVPDVGPRVEETVEGNKVKVTWTEIPRDQRGGCVTNYTIYLENGRQWSYTIPASERMHTIKDLSPADYILWMTASTAKGEGKACQKVKFFIQQETQLSLLLVSAVVVTIALFLVCVYQSSALKHRLWVYLQCVMLDDVPDPANSKWAQQCTQEKGKMNLQLLLSNSSVTEEEEEPILVDVEELPKQSSDICPLTLSPQTSRSPESTPARLAYPLTTYIKSFSHDSDSSDHTQTSLDTNTTVGYISSHGPENMDEESQEEDEDEEEFVGMLGFFPSPNIFMEPLEFGGKLTLSAVKIDCSDIFKNS
ncbi:interleukin-12 receptor subunit beta-2 [Etheostoma spectabile]|uniref:interleukin-12 receptor subunit beta-2 n=1 Tax=Etheostoma spectabile TaxID=54343 RepID=UPI0013AEC7EA|nr:interleukin-12 receptor subunit beta-2-like [Etheostoma spectabile]